MCRCRLNPYHGRSWGVQGGEITGVRGNHSGERVWRVEPTPSPKIVHGKRRQTTVSLKREKSLLSTPEDSHNP